ncbi:MAG: hypothetical protein AAF493_27360 [Pseudomonadota bacterium]
MPNLIPLLTKLGLLLPLLCIPPLLGAMWQGEDWRDYFTFPPITRRIQQPDFSLAVFLLFTGIVVATGWFFLALGRRSSLVETDPPARAPFPLFGWLGLALILIFWPLAWTRVDWFAPWQVHTFTPIWLGYILFVNGLIVWRGGVSPLQAQPAAFVALFIYSAVFWWFFEYLNRFVGNWVYDIGIPLSSTDYVYFSSIAFSTVLPAVVSTTALLRTFPSLNHRFTAGPVVEKNTLRRASCFALPLSAALLVCVGRFPDYCFPMLWLAPLLAVWALQRLVGADPLRGIEQGDWRAICLPALAALICGFGWELWNWHSMARWEYQIPFVARFYLFEMPALGYAGYLPFGVECIVATSLLSPSLAWGQSPALSRQSG